MMNRFYEFIKVFNCSVSIKLLLCLSLLTNSLVSYGDITSNISYRIVPQLNLTSLDPIKVAFSPDDNSLLVVLNENGRVDIFDIRNPGWPVKITEIFANANDVVFTSIGTSQDVPIIATSGYDGIIRLWKLDGTAEGKPFKAIDGGIETLAFSPKGSRIVSAGNDGVIRLWKLDGTSAIEPFNGQRSGISALALSPDSSRIVSVSGDGKVNLWKIDGTRVTERFREFGNKIRSVAFSPDGTLLVSGGWDGYIQLWTLDGKPSAEPFKVHNDSVLSIAFSPDGNSIISGGEDNTVRLSRLDGKPLIDQFEGHLKSVRTVAFSSDGTRMVSGSEDGTVRFWNLAFIPSGIYSGGNPVATSPDGKYIAYSSIMSNPSDLRGPLFGKGIIELIKLDGTPASKPFLGHDQTIYSIAFSPKGTHILSGSGDGTARLWNLDGTPAAEPFRGHGKGVLSVAFSPDGEQIVLGCGDGFIQIISINGEQLRNPFKAHESHVNSVAFSPDGTSIISGGGDGAIRLWKLDGNLATEPFKGHTGDVYSVAFSPDGTNIVSGGEDNTVRLWKLDGTPLGDPFQGHQTPVFSVAFSKNSTILSGGNDGMRLWTLEGKQAAEPLKISEQINSVAISWDGSLIVSGGEKVRLWKFKGKEFIEPLRGIDNNPFRVAFSPDSNRIVSGHPDGTIRVWPLDGTNPIEPFKAHDGSVFSVAFSHDGKRIVSGGGDGTIRLWTLDGKAVADPFKAHDQNVFDVAFSPNDSRLVSGGGDGYIQLWTLDGKPSVKPFKAHDNSVFSVAFSHDGKRIVSGGGDGTIRLWTLDGEAAAEPFNTQSKFVYTVAFSPDDTHIVFGDPVQQLWNISTRTAIPINSCGLISSLGFVGNKFFWSNCGDRISIQSLHYNPRGNIFLNKDSLVATVNSEGVNVPSVKIVNPFHAISNVKDILWQKELIPEIGMHRVRQVLLDDWSLRERINQLLWHYYEIAHKSYDALGWGKALFWPFVGWLFTLLLSISMWIFVPHKLAHWAMSSPGNSEIPKWKWLADILTLFGFLGSTRRPLTAWLCKNFETLYENNFSGRNPVKEREKYCDLMYKADITEFEQTLCSGKGVYKWISGEGGNGKSALAYEMLRVATANHKKPVVLPILVSEDWYPTLIDHVAELLKIDNRCPTPKMVKVLGSSGKICLLIDSLSERGIDDADNQLAEAIRKGEFNSIVVTARELPKVDVNVWEKFKILETRRLNNNEIQNYVETYTPKQEGEDNEALKNRRDHITDQIKPLITGHSLVSPLFLRFAIEQASKGDVTSTNTFDLIFKYVEKLRVGKLNISMEDMQRAAAIAASEAIREKLKPREIEREYLRGVLVAEAGIMPFNDAKNKNTVNPAALIEMMVLGGLLNQNETNRRLQFTYDPVAEYLAAWRMTQKGQYIGLEELRSRVLLSNDSPVAIAYRSISENTIT